MDWKEHVVNVILCQKRCIFIKFKTRALTIKLKTQMIDMEPLVKYVFES